MTIPAAALVPGTQIGKAFVAKQPDGEIRGEGDYCGFPIVLRLVPGERDVIGYDVAIHVRLPDPAS